MIKEYQEKYKNHHELLKQLQVLHKYKEESESNKDLHKEKMDKLLEIFNQEREKQMNLECEISRLNVIIIE